ncbi:Peptide methionine sulfoxide reductase MsrB [Serratia grimesii]|jgi:peptide-methionine (R)-S-oxide reductase|uniref:Peptide methionine sulfoxide reductase MsrB n=1 Tax=Serratia grimesii TaxID=82995 RepID=A0A7G2JSR5_9GAMM|nr:peptide-methionine (R)-S-oxide reductase MsrB [Serratia grimesii]KFB86394.1 methionine sulfoxide reductase B [Serratia grimesii]CAI0974300.1 Peptide methionine sulfoxide reductase MsrB [Serratia grimesii]CAI1018422.1 Peptide methionine sulfoxide reductase MsrB [Serratia grimesii]CAI1161619.1 Peptide methionine sulfoxide reductase MsrB [Serratia grimesii]CAI1730965.1 Peptide methionine sulfoxide reductase MsrB [Serratia grimesii]
MMNRRQFILVGGGLSAAFSLGLLPTWAVRAAATAQFEVNYTDQQWHERLSAAQYHILREEGTETPYSSPLNDEHRDGVFSCAGCDLPLFSSHAKFDSHTGWPSFYQPLDHAVAQRQDRSFGMVRDEVHCRRCGGHLGHVFDDGPQPTGLRYCMNGLALLFAPQKA